MFTAAAAKGLKVLHRLQTGSEERASQGERESEDRGTRRRYMGYK